jgi:hypothetical protein
MRRLVLALLAMVTLAPAAPASAQTYDPSYPVCLHVYGPVTYYECRYTSLTQCAGEASGRAAQCMVSPYFANASEEPQRHKRHRRIY